MTVGLTIATVHPGVVAFDWHKSIVDTLLAYSSRRHLDIHLIQVESSGPLVSRARNDTVNRFLETTSDDYFLSIDSDMVWEPDNVTKLIDDDLPIVAALSFGKKKLEDERPEFFFLDDERHKAAIDEMKNGATVLRVGWVGAGFCLVRREVLVKLGVRPLWPFGEALHNGSLYDEDAMFCIRAEAAGFPSYVDVGIKVGHRKAVII